MSSSEIFFKTSGHFGNRRKTFGHLKITQLAKTTFHKRIIEVSPSRLWAPGTGEL